MTSAVYTLFEGDYHYGVGALANSLYAQGFRGTIYAGYRGVLPPWIGKEGEVESENVTDYSPAEGLTLRFIPLTTKIHLTNYKPDFMLEVWEKHCPQAEKLFYFDPDIVVRFPWSFFEEWASDAVALCEDVNSPMPSSHPKRNAWRRLLTAKGHEWKNQPEIYVNGGFVGLTSSRKEFLKLWSQVIKQIESVGVGLNSFGSAADYRFWTTDQDALNIAVMATDCPTSCAGKDGMGFVLANGPMLHAIGSHKPWNSNRTRKILDGRLPTQVEREFWNHVETPIRMYSKAYIRRQRTFLALAAFAGRFYRR